MSVLWVCVRVFVYAFINAFEPVSFYTTVLCVCILRRSSLFITFVLLLTLSLSLSLCAQSFLLNKFKWVFSSHSLRLSLCVIFLHSIETLFVTWLWLWLWLCNGLVAYFFAYMRLVCIHVQGAWCISIKHDNDWRCGILFSALPLKRKNHQHGMNV